MIPNCTDFNKLFQRVAATCKAQYQRLARNCNVLLHLLSRGLISTANVNALCLENRNLFSVRFRAVRAILRFEKRMRLSRQYTKQSWTNLHFSEHTHNHTWYIIQASYLPASCYIVPYFTHLINSMLVWQAPLSSESTLSRSESQ